MLVPGQGDLAKIRRQLRDLLQVESQVREVGRLRCETPQRTGAGEQMAQVDVCRSHPGECGTQGSHFAKALIQREFPVCEDGGESKVLRSRTSPARNQLRTPPVKAGESMLLKTFD